MATVTICDRCGEQVPDDERGGAVSTSSEKFDLCVSCYLAFRRFIERPTIDRAA